jgi:hypothetical protein
MTVVKTVHHGGIKNGDKIIQVFTAPSRHELIKELNSWFFDYFYANRETIVELPPLDDWTHSTEDYSYWSVSFPEDIWTVWIRHEPLEFH